MKVSHKKIDMLESYAEIPWLFDGETIAWEFYQVVFDLKIPETVGNFSLMSDEERNTVLNKEKEAIIYSLNPDINNVIDRINATSENTFLYEKILEGSVENIYHIYVE